jgi:hypothetical protein
MADIEENNGFNDNIIKAKTKSHFSSIADVWNNKIWAKSNGFSNEIIKENELSLRAYEFSYGENKESIRAVCRKY